MNTLPRNLSLIIAAFGGLIIAVAEAGTPKVGEPFPVLSKFSLEGDLPELSGKIVVVDFWASWCGPCKEAFPAFKELQKKYAEKGVVIVAVSVDEDVASMNKFVSKQKPPFTIVRDKTTQLAAQLDLAGIPTTFILDKNGKVAAVHTGFFSDKTPKEYELELDRLLKSESK